MGGGCLGEGEEVHVAAGSAETERPRVGIHVARAQIRALLSGSKVSLPASLGLIIERKLVRLGFIQTKH